MGSVNVIGSLEKYLSLNSKRETLIASNMANVDTPGYHTQDFDFEGAFREAASRQQPGQDAAVQVRQVPGLLERPDGNNVDLDRESMLLSQAQLQNQIGTQLLKSRFHQLLTAIGGGQ